MLSAGTGTEKDAAGSDSKDAGSSSGDAAAAEKTTQTRRGLTAKLLEGLLQNKEEVTADAEAKTAIEFLEGPRLDIFPGKEKALENVKPTEDEQIEQWRQKLESLTAKKHTGAMDEIGGMRRFKTMQEFHGDKYGDLSDHMNRKLYDNDSNAAPDIRKVCMKTHFGKPGLPLEEQIQYFNKMIMESGAINKLELCQALPVIMCSTKWTMTDKENVLRDHMQGVVDPERQERMARRKKMNEDWFAVIRAKKKGAQEEKERLAQSNLYDLQQEEDAELDYDDDGAEDDWETAAEEQRKANIARKASRRAAYFNSLRARKSQAKAKKSGRKF